MLCVLPQPCTKSLRDLNVSQNRCGDNGLFMLKLGLLANRSLERLNLSTTKMTCEGKALWMYNNIMLHFIMHACMCVCVFVIIDSVCVCVIYL